MSLRGSGATEAIYGIRNQVRYTEFVPLTTGQREALLRVAREAIRRRLAGEKYRPAPVGDLADPVFWRPAAVFVTLQKHGRLRGCIGTPEADRPLAEAVATYAVRSACEDPRFSPLEKGEEKEVRIEISILSPFRKCRPEEIRSGVHGVMVKHGGRAGLFLPQVWEQLPDKEGFMSALCWEKAGLEPDAWKTGSCDLYLFTVESFSEPA